MFWIRNIYYREFSQKVYFKVSQIQMTRFFFVVDGVTFEAHSTPFVRTLKISYYRLSAVEYRMEFQNNQVLTFEGCFGFHRLLNADERR